MSKTNHQRGFKAVKDSDRYAPSRAFVINHGGHRLSTFADVYKAAGLGWEFTNGHRGFAKAKRGAKKFVRTRIRFHEKQQLHKELTAL